MTGRCRNDGCWGGNNCPLITDNYRKRVCFVDLILSILSIHVHVFVIRNYAKVSFSPEAITANWYISGHQFLWFTKQSLFHQMPFISENKRGVTPIRRLGLFFVVTVFLGMYAPCFADSLRSKEELKSLKTKIDNLQTKLKSRRNKAQTLLVDVDTLEHELVELVAERSNQKRVLETLKAQKTQLDKNRHDLALVDDEMQQKLRQILRASYIFGRQDSIRLILNQQQPENRARTWAMYRYFIASQKKQIEQIKRHQLEVREVVGRLKNQQTAIDQTLARLDENALALGKAKQARKSQLNRVQEKLSKDQRQVARYQQRQAELELLLKNLQRQESQNNRQSTHLSDSQAVGKATQSAPNRQAMPLVAGGFKKNKGRLSMPIIGEIENRFGQRKPESGLSWKGLMFKVAEGQKVLAIYSGQVVFSDWFRGYGQLLVLDHGDGYMSLYGHNQLLQAPLGTAVDAGQVVAFAGSTGGLRKPGLYFEIRYNGVADDPLRWCRL